MRRSVYFKRFRFIIYKYHKILLKSVNNSGGYIFYKNFVEIL